jgi:hypothetical protein
MFFQDSTTTFRVDADNTPKAVFDVCSNAWAHSCTAVCAVDHDGYRESLPEIRLRVSPVSPWHSQPAGVTATRKAQQ